MSVENGKVCCNCRHCKRIIKEHGKRIECHCDRDNAYLTYSTVLGHWCRHWAKEREDLYMNSSQNNKSLRYASERWIITDDGRCICPDCGKSSFRFKFCPHCGALNRPESEAEND